MWFPVECLFLFEGLREWDYFILQGTVQTVAENPKARYLRFDSMLRGRDVVQDPLLQQYYWDKTLSLFVDAYEILDEWQVALKRNGRKLPEDVGMVFYMLEHMNYEEVDRLLG